MAALPRRAILRFGGGGLLWLSWAAHSNAKPESFAFSLSDTGWRARLTPDQYAVLRQQHTEPPGSSPLNREKRKGVFACAGCEAPLFPSSRKFESGTGWPSFSAALAKAVATRADYSQSMTRTEVHCRRCGSHLGHLFNDGPRPSGLRYCINGLALLFLPA